MHAVAMAIIQLITCIIHVHVWIDDETNNGRPEFESELEIRIEICIFWEHR